MTSEQGQTVRTPLLWRTMAVSLGFLLVLCGVVVNDWIQTKREQDLVAEWQESAAEGRAAATGLAEALASFDAGLIGISSSGDDARWATIDADLETVRRQAERLAAAHPSMAERLTQRLVRLEDGFQNVRSASGQPDLDALVLDLKRDGIDLSRTGFEVSAALQQFWLDEVRRLEESGRPLTKLLLAALLILGSVAMATLIGSVVRMHATMKAVVQATASLSRGEMVADSHGLDPARKDEIGRIDRSLNTLIGLLNDVTAARDELKSLSVHDPLTGLPNRRGLDETLEAWMRGEDPLPVVTAMHIDLDHFKAINDSLGHDAGDHVLSVAAKRMTAAVRDDDVVARVGGDEFVVLLPELDDLARLAQIATRLIEGLSAPMEHEGRVCQIGASIGIAIGGAYHELEDPEELLKDADLAVFKSKANGRGRFSVFDKSMRTLIEHQRAMAIRLSDALENDRIEAWLQPVVDMSGTRLLSVEALARWRDPDLGLVSAEDFIEIAKQRNMIVDIRTVVMAHASRAVAGWIADGLDVPQVTFNLSAGEMKSIDLVDEIKWALEHARLDPSRVAVELGPRLTRDRSAEVILGSIDRLRDLGVSIVVDDVDFDNPPTTDLQRMGARLVKLNPKVTENLGQDPDHALHLTRLIELLESMQVRVYGKAVDDEALIEHLKKAGLCGVQGRLIAPPMALDEFAIWLDGFLADGGTGIGETATAV